MPHKKPRKLPTKRRLQNKLDEFADDVRSIRLEFLDKSVAKSKSKMNSEDWEPFFVYRNTLMQREVESTSGRRKRMEKSSSPESSSATSFDLRTPSPVSVQPLTSTAIRKAYQHVELSSITEY